MKKLYLLFIPLFISLLFIFPKAYTNDQAFNAVYNNLTLTNLQLNQIINFVDNNTSFGPNTWLNYYYITYAWNNSGTDVIDWLFIDRATGNLKLLTLSRNNEQLTVTELDKISFRLSDMNVLMVENNQPGQLRTFNNDFMAPNFRGDPQGRVIYSNLPIQYQDNSGNWVYLINRTIPNELWPETHPMYQKTVLDGQKVDSIVDTNLTTILDEFDIDLLFENLESVLEQIYGFIESAFLSLNEVITYITSSLNNVVSFVTANITIISIISMVYLALPSILRDLFTLALSTSVVFIMLRRFI